MEKKCGIFGTKGFVFKNFWISLGLALHIFRNVWTVVGLALGFKHLVLDLESQNMTVRSSLIFWDLLLVLDERFAQPDVFAVANCAEVALSVYSRDGYWTGLGLDWIWTTTNFVDFGLDLDCKTLHKFKIRTGYVLS